MGIVKVRFDCTEQICGRGACFPVFACWALVVSKLQELLPALVRQVSVAGKELQRESRIRNLLQLPRNELSAQSRAFQRIENSDQRANRHRGRKIRRAWNGRASQRGQVGFQCG